MKYKRALIACFSDPHAAFRLGLMNPETLLQDDGYYRPVHLEEPQEFLWNTHIEAKENTEALADKDPIYAFCGGDLTHGDKYPIELVSTRMVDQIDIAGGNSESPGIFDPVLKMKNVKALRVNKGTGAHNFGESSADILVVDKLKTRYPKKDIRVVYHGLTTIKEAGNIVIDHRHHGPGPGTRMWLKGNVARYYLRDYMLQEILNGNTPADILLRGHYHTCVEEILIMNGYRSLLTLLPPMCFPGDFAMQVIRNLMFIEFGWVVFEVINGKIHETHKFTQKLDVRSKEKI